MLNTDPVVLDSSSQQVVFKQATPEASLRKLFKQSYLVGMLEQVIFERARPSSSDTPIQCEHAGHKHVAIGFERQSSPVSAFQSPNGKLLS